MDDLTAQITTCLRDYTNEVTDKINAAIDEVGTQMLKDVKDKSPKKTGEYKRGWKKKTETSQGGNKSVTVYNDKKPKLTHLLEHGHAKRNGGRVNAIPHIYPAEQKAIQELERRIREELGR